jgi:hypothetical protein
MKLFIISSFSCKQAQTYCPQHRSLPDDEPGTTSIESSAAGKRKRASSQSASLSSKTQSNYNRTVSRLAVASRSGSIVSAAIPRPRPVILKSAYRAPVQREQITDQWTRDPPMTELLFIRTKAVINKDGTVEFSVSDGFEAIQVAGDWKKGQTLHEEGKPHETTGFVGMGYSKRGIYVSCRLHQAIRKRRFNDLTLGEIWWDGVCFNTNHGWDDDTVRCECCAQGGVSTFMSMW